MKWLERYFEENLPRRSEQLDSGRAPFFRLLADQWFLRAALDHAAAAPALRVAGHLRQGLQEMRVAFELGHVANVWELWDFFFYALAASDRNCAYFVATLPERCWEPPGESLQWLLAQLKTAFSLFQHDDLEAAVRLSEARTLVFEDPLPTGVAKDAPEIRNLARILETLLQKDAAGLNRALTERLEIRNKAKGNVLMSALDLHALGLAWMARDRGIEVTVRHALLPLALLER
mgnify:CR=1 FL=1